MKITSRLLNRDKFMEKQQLNMVSATPNRTMQPEFRLRYQEAMDYLSKPVSSYTLLYEPHLISKSKVGRKRKVGVQKGTTKARTFQAPKCRSDSTSTNKLEKKATKNTYKLVTNVKTLTASGMFDGVTVRYVSKTKKKELLGIIEGSAYLCGCESCNFSKTVNAYEFELHAGCKTSHPNNHIHFANDKSMHMVVQELKSTPENMLFDVIQTVTGSAINEKAFCAWKESFQATSSKS